METQDLAEVSEALKVLRQDLAEVELVSVALKFLRQDLWAELELVSLALVSDLKPGRSDESSQ